MNSEEVEALAAEYVLETLDEGQRSAFERKLMDDPELQNIVAQWEDRLGLLAEAGPAIEPSAQLWAAIEAETERLPLPGLTTVRRAEVTWETIGRGLQRKILFVNRVEGYLSFLLRLAPGARLPDHGHRLPEECVVLEGEMIVGKQRLGPGDYHVAEANSIHRDVYSETGGVVFIRAQLDEMTASPGI